MGIATTEPFLGIDFGTSKSSMAWVNPSTNHAELLRNAEGRDATPSVIYYGERETLVGEPAEHMIEDEAERQRVVLSIKRDLVNAPTLALPGKRVKRIEIVAEVLRKLKRDAEERRFHQKVTRAVITVPAAFDAAQRRKIKEAGKLAGFTEVELLEEPVAAALAYGRAGQAVGDSILVYDLGAGTFDLALLARENGTFRLACEPRGLARCGGDDFDRALYDYCEEIAQQPEVMARRTELADIFAKQLGNDLNAVIPVSAGLQRALDDLCAEAGQGLRRIIEAVRRIPAAPLTKLLGSEDYYLELEPPDCPVTTEARAGLLGSLSWGVFTTIARTAADPTLPADAVAGHLRELAGFATLHETLEQHFFRRSQFLRSFRILVDARRLLNEITYRILPERRRRAREEGTRRERFLAFLDRTRGDRATAAELRTFVEAQFPTTPDIEAVVADLDLALSQAFHELEEYNADFDALRQIETHPDLFGAAEVDELRALFGLYGLETTTRLRNDVHLPAYVERQQQTWWAISKFERHPIRREVADRAVTRYGFILDDLSTHASGT